MEIRKQPKRTNVQNSIKKYLEIPCTIQNRKDRVNKIDHLVE